ncbi:DUF2975 domain-containing protein [Marinicella sp. S1101]|uniref:DUF2975 domain-containing protein n=1 Tax=Marinicella marina TaxID=2996016 RepID=UPI002260A446|nr:DUF2975 domain-containing protein [Marinicella marina]MCX7555049.1 DUF2975 domain-containing protein [Marinicella marina]MDJ1141357.1 DUF2975 domain-containing protein [Marinicella marina]
MKTQTILNIMFFLAWFVFIALLIKTGAVVTTYTISLFNSDAAKHLYFDMDLSMYLSHSLMHYSILALTKVLLFSAQAYVAFLVTELLKDFNLKNPFSQTVVHLMERICFSILFIAFLTVLHNGHIKALEQVVGVGANGSDDAYLLWAAMVYVMAQVFKRGIEIQNENDFTI